MSSAKSRDVPEARSSEDLYRRDRVFQRFVNAVEALLESAEFAAIAELADAVAELLSVTDLSTVAIEQGEWLACWRRRCRAGTPAIDEEERL